MNDVCGWSVSQRIRSRFDRNPIFPASPTVFDSIPRLQVLLGCPRHSLEGLAAELGVPLEARFQQPNKASNRLLLRGRLRSQGVVNALSEILPFSPEHKNTHDKRSSAAHNTVSVQN